MSFGRILHTFPIGTWSCARLPRATRVLDQVFRRLLRGGTSVALTEQPGDPNRSPGQDMGMMHRYGGSFEIVSVRPLAGGGVEREVTFARWMEVQANSASEAREKMLADAKRAGWRPRKAYHEVPGVIEHLRVLDPEPRTYYGFRYETEGGYTVKWNYYIGSKNYVPGTLYRFDSKRERDDWVARGDAAKEIRKAVRVNALPEGWYAQDALDPEEEWS